MEKKHQALLKMNAQTSSQLTKSVRIVQSNKQVGIDKESSTVQIQFSHSYYQHSTIHSWLQMPDFVVPYFSRPSDKNIFNVFSPQSSAIATTQIVKILFQCVSRKILYLLGVFSLLSIFPNNNSTSQHISYDTHFSNLN